MAQSSSSANLASYSKLEKSQDEDETPPRYSAGDREEADNEIDLEHGASTSLLKEQDSEHNHSSQFPSEADTADIVRTFLNNTLTLKYNVSSEESHSTASKWSMGTGKELRTFPPHVFREIFGGEAGWVIFKEVKIQLEEEKLRKQREKEGGDGSKKWSKKTKGWIAAGYCLTAIAVIFTMIAVLGGTWTITVTVASVLLVFSTFIAIGIAASGDNDGASMAEIELKQMYAKSVE